MRISTKTILLILVSVFLIALAGSVLGVQYFWDTEHQTAFFQQKIETIVQRPTHVHKARLELFPRIRVVLEKVAIGDRDNGVPVISLEKLRVGFALRPLFAGVVHCNMVSLDQPRIIVVRNADGTFNVMDLVERTLRNRAAEEPSGGSWFDTFRFRLGKFAVRDGTLNFADKAVGDTPVRFEFSDLNFRTGTVAASGVTPVTFTARLAEKLGESARITLKGEIGPLLDRADVGLIRFTGELGVTDLGISRFGPYLKRVDEHGAIKGTVSGSVSFAGTLKGKLHADAKLDIENLLFEERNLFEEQLGVAQAGLEFSLTRDREEIRLSDIRLALPELEAEGKLLVTCADPRLIEGELKIQDCAYRHLLPYLPLLPFPKAVKKVMIEHIVKGTIDSLLLRYSTESAKKASSAPPMGALEFLSGHMSFSEFTIAFLEDIPLVTGLNGELSLNDQNLTLADIGGRFGNSEILEGKMALSRWSFFDTTLGLTLDLHELFTLLHHPRMPENAAHHLSKLKYMDGAAQLKLDASGPLNDFGSLAFGGKMEVLGATVDYHHFRKVGRNVRGTIHFTPYLIKSDNLKGYWANSPITAWFKIENYLSRPKAMLTAHVESDKSEINDVASAFFPWEGVSGRGWADIYVDLSCAEYRTQKLYFEGAATFADLMLTFPGFPHPFVHIGGNVDFSSQGLRFYDVRAETGSSAFSFDGRWDDLRSPVISGALRGTAIDLLDFHARPSAKEKKQLSQYAVDNLSVTIQEARCKDFSFNDLETTICFDQGKATLTSFTAAKGRFRGFDFVKLSSLREKQPAPIAYQNRVATIPYLALESQGGVWVGTDISLPLWSEDDKVFSVTSSIENISVEEFLQCFAADKQRLTGTLNLTGSVSGAGKNLSDSMKSWSGTVDLSVENGVLMKHGVMAKILSLLNVARIFKQDYSNLLAKGMHYNTIEGAFRVEEGIARTDNFFFDSSSVKMDAVGDIDLRERLYDMEIAVAPLETVDKVVEKIPLIGTVLMGDEGALVVTYYKLTGPFDQPELKQVVFTSLGRKAQGIFQRIFRLPGTILNRENKDTDEKRESDT